MAGNLFDLSGKRALVTGSSRGLGLVLARGLGQAGATVILNGRTEATVNDAVSNLSALGIATHGYPFDVTQSQDIARAVKSIEADLGPIDILVNNAGIQKRAPLETFEESDWRQVLETNLTSAFLVSRQVVAGMIGRRAGKIVNVCSLQSELGRPTIAPYAASKGGLKMLTRGMATEWGKHNIQVNGIGPGYFITEMTRPLADNPQFDAWLKARTPMNRWGDPTELVGTLVYLSSAASSFVTGQIVYVDGGILACI